MLLSLYLFHMKQISKSKATEQICGGSPCFSVLTVAKHSCDGHGYFKAGEEQFTLSEGFSPSLLQGADLTGRWHALNHSRVTHGVRRHLKWPAHSKIPATELEQLKSFFLCCWLVLAHSRTQSSRYLQLWAACFMSHPPFCEGVWFCLPRLIALIFRPASFSTVGSHYRQGTLSQPGQSLSHSLNCMVRAKEKVLAMLESHLFKSIHPNFLEHYIFTTYHL